ncbi:MAG: hypothetical protein K9I71_12095 [Ignavibacteriales bacterium]|nr:hypothetical protein [Ignavibacteriales bacterium]MCF8316862.1 hypothetical protein [Ignavibacteriales bacterium]MCF8438099.1 hypothetical protein [Ignavibacteriales bacterium]
MPGKYLNKYRISSARLQNWDYNSNAPYFITICTAHKKHYFGNIVETRFIASPTNENEKNNLTTAQVEGRFIASPTNENEKNNSTTAQVEGRFIASPTGMIAEQIWNEIPIQFPFTELGNFVVMPNHVHGIIIISKPECTTIVPGNPGVPANADAINRASSNVPVGESGGFARNKNPMVNDNLSRIIRWYKGRVSFEAHKIDPGFEWQSRFYDHIIRDEKSFFRISEYITNNPANWAVDKFRQ